MKRFFAVVMLVLSMYAVAPAASAQSYVGAWKYGNDGNEYLYLGDNSDGMFLFLRGAPGYCSRPGASYSLCVTKKLIFTGGLMTSVTMVSAITLVSVSKMITVSRPARPIATWVGNNHHNEKRQSADCRFCFFVIAA
jgi:hypothetical protein